MKLKERSTLLQYLLVALVAIAAYADTLTLDYALDDRMIIYENNYTLQGWEGIDSVLTQDAFTGFFGDQHNLVAGGRYRPLSQLTFIAEYEMFGGKLKSKVGLNRAPQNEALFSRSILPTIQHANNVLLFTLLCLLTLAVLRLIFPPSEERRWWLTLPFLATLLFALHPLHTEAVANIKGRDEIMAMLGAMGALYCSLRFCDRRRWYWLILSFLAMAFALFSKENAITFLAVVPLALYFQPGSKKKSDYVLTLLPITVASAIFLIVRYIFVIAPIAGQQTNELLLNNPFLHTDKAHEIATVLFTWAIYLKLMLFPHPLTHDYYPHEIKIVGFDNLVVWMVILLIVVLLYFAIRHFKKRGVLSFAILYFIITFSITSNLLFNVGTFMNERFLFMPLLGFTIATARLFEKWAENEIWQKMATGSIVLLCLLYTGKTVVRNLTWKDDDTLFTTDVQTSHESMKCNLSAAGSFMHLYEKEHKEMYLGRAEKCLKKTMALGRGDNETYSLLGKLYFLKKDYAKSAAAYEQILAQIPHDAEARANLEVVHQMEKREVITQINKLMDANEVQEALKMALAELENTPEVPELLNVTGRIYGEKLRQMPTSIRYLEKAVEVSPDYASAHENLGIAYAIIGDFAQGIAHLSKAHELEPDNQQITQNLAQVYRRSQQAEKAAALEKEL